MLFPDPNRERLLKGDNKAFATLLDILMALDYRESYFSEQASGSMSTQQIFGLIRETTTKQLIEVGWGSTNSHLAEGERARQKGAGSLHNHLFHIAKSEALPKQTDSTSRTEIKRSSKDRSGLTKTIADSKHSGPTSHHHDPTHRQSHDLLPSFRGPRATTASPQAQHP